MFLPRFLAAAGLALAAASSRAGDVYIVSSPNVSLSAEELRDVFLGDKQFAGGVKLTPIENASLQPEFQSRVLKLDAGRYSTLWAKKGFRDGLIAPPVRASDAEVVNGVRTMPGTVGYVSRPTPDVKVLAKY